MRIHPVEQRDAADWERMRQLLWPSAGGEHAGEIAAFLAERRYGKRDGPAEVFIARDDAGRAIGFAELAIRPYAEDCYSGRVAFLEGWYVDPAARGKGVGAALVRAAEEWGRSQRCMEMASDAAIENAASAAAHKALGFEETARIICFRKPL